MIQAKRAIPPWPVKDEPQLSFRMTHEEMIQRFGSAHGSWDASDGEPGPCEYWAFRFPCGLVIVIVWHLYAAVGNVNASAPAMDHILHHLAVEKERIYWRLDRAEPKIFRDRYGDASGGCPLDGSSPQGA